MLYRLFINAFGPPCVILGMVFFIFHDAFYDKSEVLKRIAEAASLSTICSSVVHGMAGRSAIVRVVKPGADCRHPVRSRACRNSDEQIVCLTAAEALALRASALSHLLTFGMKKDLRVSGGPWVL